MAVFKEKNGAMKAGGCACGQTRPQFQVDRLTFDQGNPTHPQLVRDSANGRNVRAAATASGGSVRKGGGSEKNN